MSDLHYTPIISLQLHFSVDLLFLVIDAWISHASNSSLWLWLGVRLCLHQMPLVLSRVTASFLILSRSDLKLSSPSLQNVMPFVGFSLVKFCFHPWLWTLIIRKLVVHLNFLQGDAFCQPQQYPPVTWGILFIPITSFQWLFKEGLKLTSFKVYACQN